MPNPQLEERLFQTARLGIAFEKWRDLEPTQAFMQALRDDAENASKKCVQLSPFTQAQELADAQQEVNTYNLLIIKIERFIHEGAAAEEALRSPEPFEDE